MTSTRVESLKKHVQQVRNYLEQFLPLANVHMVDYFTKNAYKNFIPIEIRTEINGLGYKEVINKIFNNDYKGLPHIHEFWEKSRELTLKNSEICLKTRELQNKLISLGCSDVLRLKLNIFMTSKKSHEVEILSYFAAALKTVSGTSHLIDIGDGKGYLSSMLALHHKIPVLGVDSSEINTNGAITRVKKLSRVWNSEISKKKNVTCTPVQEETTVLNEKEVDLYKQITKYVDDKIDFVELISDTFLRKPNGLGLVGLHTCGNLSTTSLKIFASNENVKTICNVGCCYHFLTESFEFDTFDSDKKEDCPTYGFPMSQHLRGERFKIGRAGRMIAAQSVDRILDKKELPNETLFYRALFEIVLSKEFPDLPAEKRQVGRFRKKAQNFVDYTKKALEKLELCITMSDSEVENLYEKYKERQYELYVFFLLRNMLAPIIECLILLDRLLYLQEMGFERSYLVQFFDPVVSPRCYGLVAMK